MSVQFGFIRKGTAQQKLMPQLASSIAADFIDNAEQCVEKVGTELVMPLVIFYFMPYLLIDFEIESEILGLYKSDERWL